VALCNLKIPREAGKELKTRFRWEKLHEVRATARIFHIVSCGWMNGDTRLIAAIHRMLDQYAVAAKALYRDHANKTFTRGNDGAEG
jgi:hypothetical protein